ncbi:unnamed protein product [Gadus morhua 'NCC']
MKKFQISRTRTVDWFWWWTMQSTRSTAAGRLWASEVRWGSALTPRWGPEEEGWMSGRQKVVLVTVGDRVGRGGPTRMASVLELLSCRSEGAEWSRTEGLRTGLEMQEGGGGLGRGGGGGAGGRGGGRRGGGGGGGEEEGGGGLERGEAYSEPLTPYTQRQGLLLRRCLLCSSETHVLEALIQAQMKALEGSKRIQRFLVNGSKPKALERDVTEMDPALRLMLQEKERAVRTLQETVEGVAGPPLRVGAGQRPLTVV